MSWYKDWFNSPYYATLYKHRDEKEAEDFLDRIISLLRPEPGSRILDMGCGRGRHSIYLNKKGFNVTGIDLSEASIAEASRYENDTLRFYLHDMRNLFRINYYDIVLNLFTSFGYSSQDRENIAVILSAYKSLKKEGIFVLDYMNSKHVIKNLVKEEEKTAGDTAFYITREITDHSIVKKIQVNDKGEYHFFKEEVKSYTPGELKSMFTANGFSILHLFGDYKLNAFHEELSERAIFILKKST